MNNRILAAVAGASLLALAAAGPALAAGRTIGQPVEREEMVIVMQYIQAVTMDGMNHAGHGATGGGPGDAHFEAIIYASKNSSFGFQPGEWIPYLDIQFVVSKEGSDFKTAGRLMPMLASDGPHYGANLDLAGPGKYKVAMTFTPPSAEVFPRHTDKETAAAAWWRPFTEEWDFTFVGSVGKKGGY